MSKFNLVQDEMDALRDEHVDNEIQFEEEEGNDRDLQPLDPQIKKRKVRVALNLREQPTK